MPPSALQKEADERMARAAKVALECVRAIQSRISSAILRIHEPRELAPRARSVP